MSERAEEARVITVDGPAGAGKSTIARRLAGRLGLDFLDTGAMYRGVAAAALDCGMDPSDADAVADLADRLRVTFNWSADPPALRIDGLDLTHRLRDGDVTASVSDIASNARVRGVLVRAQRWIGREHPRLVTEGRDQGSVVFPDALVKFYLDATPEVRARRRARQLHEAGREADEQKILEQIRYRDERDATRLDGPLIRPLDAIYVDTSAMTLEQVVDALAEHAGAALREGDAKSRTGREVEPAAANPGGRARSGGKRSGDASGGASGGISGVEGGGG